MYVPGAYETGHARNESALVTVILIEYRLAASSLEAARPESLAVFCSSHILAFASLLKSPQSPQINHLRSRCWNSRVATIAAELVFGFVEYIYAYYVCAELCVDKSFFSVLLPVTTLLHTHRHLHMLASALLLVFSRTQTSIPLGER